MAQYHFVTRWTIGAPMADVWEQVGDPEMWKSYWPGLEDVRLLSGERGGVRGSRYELVFKSFLPYTLKLEAAIMDSEAPKRLILSTTGELEGQARYDLESLSDTQTSTCLVWDTNTTQAWMNLLAPVFRGLFEWNHDLLMRRAAHGLAQKLETEVIPEDSDSSLLRALAPVAGVAAALWLSRRLFRRA